LILGLVLVSCDSSEYTDTATTEQVAVQNQADHMVSSKADNSQACWGQATRVFAQTGEMGEHSSQQPNPRLGLRNLARALADQGVIPDDSMQSLGAFVASELGLSIDACM
jgi:hypothetical protein